MKQRIQQIMDREGMTPGRFADSIGIQRSALSHILNGRNNPSLDVLTKVLNRFEYLSTDWLMFGNAPMFKHQQNDEGSNSLSNEIFHVDETEQGSSSTELSPRDLPISGNMAPKVGSPVLKEVVIKEVEKMRTISKIMIFYSDNTFENFVPETPGKVSKL